MSKKTMLNLVSPVLVAVAAAALVAGCASTSVWNPGDPDAATIEHYTLAVNAVEAKNLEHAQAALYLLQDDVARLNTDTLHIAAELANVCGAINSVDKQDWDQALDRLQGLAARYGRQSSAQSQ